MPIRVGLNGVGRIGRLVLRHLMESQELELIAANDVAPPDNIAYLLRYDSVQRNPDVPVSADGDVLKYGDKEIKFLNEKSPSDLPWKDLGVDIVLEAAGVFTKREQAVKHVDDAGAKKVIVTAPSKGAELTVCLGVNEDKFNKDEHVVISNASCTTNTVAVVAKVLNDEFGITKGMMNTVHAYTSTQEIVDGPAKKIRRGRAAALSTIPTTTGAAEATTEVIPELKGKLAATAMRVPVACGSIIDFVVQTEKPASAEAVNDAFRQAAESDRMKNILGVSDEYLVSVDIIGTKWSALVDAKSTKAVGDDMVEVFAWYDNEWAYALRVVELAEYIGKHI